MAMLLGFSSKVVQSSQSRNFEAFLAVKRINKRTRKMNVFFFLCRMARKTHENAHKAF